VRTGALADGWTVEEPPRTRVARPEDGVRNGFWASVGGRHKPSVDLVVEVWCRTGPDIAQAPLVSTQTVRMEIRDRPAAGVEELHRVAGTVTGADGAPAAGAWVVVPDGAGFAVADAGGRFAIGSMRRGRHRLLARGADGADATISVDVPGPPADIRLA
jgi:Carboxypeptidase regulatory-like domain